MTLKNSTSTTNRTFDRIQKALSSHGAKQIMFDYNDNGQVQGLAFTLEIKGQIVGFKMPARFENVERIFFDKKNKSNYYHKELTIAEKDQAYRTAWANIRDWIEAQMALIETEMVKPEEVFLPYATDSRGRTVFERFESGNLQLGSGESEPPKVIPL